MATKNVIGESNKVSASQLKDFFRQIDEGGITGDHIQAILERRNPFSCNLKKKSISKKDKLYEVEVDGTKTLEELLVEGGYGQYKSINYNFRIINKTKRKINIKLFSFNDSLLFEKIITEMLNENFEPTTIDELLNLGIQYPQLQSKFNIVALGTVEFKKADGLNTFLDEKSVPVLRQGNNMVDLVESNHYWNSSKFKFAGSQIIE